MKSFKAWLWAWPDGVVWKATRKASIASRKRKFELFMEHMKPGAETTVLDVGVSGAATDNRGENFLEEWYAFPRRITALGVDDLSKFQERYPCVQVVSGDGKSLPFSDKSFDIVFSNAVIEHVGDAENQKKFVAECLRAGKRVFLTTPARTFPLEAHTMIPFVHWLPRSLRNSIYRKLGRVHEGTGDNLVLLSGRSLRAVFPRDAKVKIVRQRMLGMTTVLIAIAE